MYYDYFGLRQPPFRITPDTNLFFPGGNRGAVLEALVYAITHGEGIVKVVGEVGSGKTMLCRMLEQELPDNVEVIYLANPSLSPDDILHAIAFELGLTLEPGADRLEVMQKLQDYLLKRHAGNRQVVMFVEEAQGMPLETLEEIRLLSNLETSQHKLLQIVLFGQPELDENLAQPHIRQLRERITYSFDLVPFRREQVRDYLNSRLRACGCNTDGVFSPGAVRAITRHSQGLLRRINILADKAMLAAYAEGSRKIRGKHVRVAARDSEFHVSRSLSWLLATVLLLVLAGAAAWFLPGGPASTGRAGTVAAAPEAAATPRAPATAEPAPPPAAPTGGEAGPVQGQAPTATTARAATASGLTPQQQAAIDRLQPLLEDPVDPVTLRGL